MTFIDLRSDTVTRPDAEMRRAMADAEVGDDVFREDPTVRRLEERAAELLGFPAALFVPTGTMGNQIALHLHGRPGGEVLAERNSHVFLYELGAMAALSGLMPKALEGEGGRLQAEVVEAAIAPRVDYRSATVALVLENTHNAAGGTVWTRAEIEPVLAVAGRAGLPVHLDGARVWNAAVAIGTTPAALTAGFDSTMSSLSKGLGCPSGSVLAGSTDFIAAARRVRKMFGGGMRQVGILAAAGLVAFDRGLDHLAVDHARAKELAMALAAIPGVRVDVGAVVTNIVLADLDRPAGPVLEGLAARGVGCVPFGPQRLRFVTHRDLPGDAVVRATEALAAVVAAR